MDDLRLLQTSSWKSPKNPPEKSSVILGAILRGNPQTSDYQNAHSSQKSSQSPQRVSDIVTFALQRFASELQCFPPGYQKSMLRWKKLSVPIYPPFRFATPAAADDAFVFANSPCSFVGRDSPGKQQLVWCRNWLVPETLSHDQSNAKKKSSICPFNKIQHRLGQWSQLKSLPTLQ